MSDRLDDRWTIRVDEETRKGITRLADLHGCSIGQLLRRMYRRMVGLPIDETRPIREDDYAG